MAEARRLSVGSIAAWAVIAASFVVELGTASWDGFESRVPSRALYLLRYPAYAAGVFAIVAVALRRRLARRTDFGLDPPRARPDLYLQSFAIYIGLHDLGARSAGVWTNVSWLGSVAWYAAPFVALAWPLARGVRWRDLASDLGLSRGRGWGREILVGVVAALVLHSVRCALNLATWALWGVSEDAGRASAPLIDRALYARWVAILLVWAPAIEETMFRGLLFRGVRGFSRWVASGVVTALLFALIHTPSWGWPSLLLEGFGLALLREWRRSLVPAMVAHALLNSVVAYYFIVLILLA